MSTNPLILRRRMMFRQGEPGPHGSGLVTATYSVADISTPTTILNSVTGFASMSVDDTPETLATSFQFNETGAHTVIFKLLNVSTLPSGAFRGVTSLVSIVFSEGLTTVGDSAFFECTNLGDIILPEGVTTIQPSAFRSCSSITSVDFPSTMSSIGWLAFANSANIQKYICRATTPPFLDGQQSLRITSEGKIYVPYSADHSILSAYQSSAAWSAYSSKMVELNQDGTIPS